MSQARSKVVIVGCGIIGAAIAYELSQVSQLEVTVLEAQPSAGQGSTKSALGVMMAACSITTAYNEPLSLLRLISLRRYESLVPELATKTGIEIPFNRHGIVLLVNDLEGDLEFKWKGLIERRAKQGFRMKWLDSDDLSLEYPQLRALAGVCSYDDRAIHPGILVQALVVAAKLNGVEFKYDFSVQNLNELDKFAPDHIVFTAGLGSNPLIQQIIKSKTKPDLLFPVGGQAIRVFLPKFDLKTIIHSADLNIVPLGHDQYWIGATVEFSYKILPRVENESFLLAQITKICPAFAQAKILESWAGDRPRPKFQGAPIIGFVPNQPNILVAIGHYRNGVLMAPATAQIIKDLILSGKSDLPWQKQQLKP